MAYSRALGRVVMFGGFAHLWQGWFRETWAWDGADWSLLDSNGPESVNAAMFEDPVTEKLLLVAWCSGGGCTGYLTYEWIAGGWRPLDVPAIHPTGGHVSVSRSLGVAVLDANGPMVWNGRSWGLGLAGTGGAAWPSGAVYDERAGEFLTPTGTDTIAVRGDFSAIVTGTQMPVTVNAGRSITLHADVREFAPGITYKWQLPTDTASRATGQDTPTLTINPALTRDSEQLTLRIATPCGAFDAVKLSPIVIPCPEDLYGGDAFVDINDLQLLLLYWNQPIPPGFTFNPDINGDGLVNTADLVRLLVRFGRPCE